MSVITTRDKVDLYLKDWGAGRAVVMLHGWPLSSDTFDDMGLAIANAGMRAIAYDRRGFGRSDQPWDGYDYDSLADDLADVIEKTGAEDVTLVGFSMGGGEVARYMSRHNGAKVQRAVLISSVVPSMLKTSGNPHGVEQATFDQMTLAMKEDRAAFFTTFFKQFYGIGVMAQPVSDEVLRWSRQIAMRASLKATLDCASAFATTEFHPDLEAFRVPTLVIHGNKDQTVPIDATARITAARIPDCEFIEYDGGPHGLFASHKVRLIEDVLRFVRSGHEVGTLADTR